MKEICVNGCSSTLVTRMVWFYICTKKYTKSRIWKTELRFDWPPSILAHQPENINSCIYWELQLNTTKVREFSIWIIQSHLPHVLDCGTWSSLHEPTEDDTMMFYASSAKECAWGCSNRAKIELLIPKGSRKKKSPTCRWLLQPANRTLNKWCCLSVPIQRMGSHMAIASSCSVENNS